MNTKIERIEYRVDALKQGSRISKYRPGIKIINRWNIESKEMKEREHRDERKRVRN